MRFDEKITREGNESLRAQHGTRRASITLQVSVPLYNFHSPSYHILHCGIHDACSKQHKHCNSITFIYTTRRLVQL